MLSHKFLLATVFLLGSGVTVTRKSWMELEKRERSTLELLVRGFINLEISYSVFLLMKERENERK